MFGLGPVFAMVVGPRLVASGARPRMRNSVLATDVGFCWVQRVSGPGGPAEVEVSFNSRAGYRRASRRDGGVSVVTNRCVPCSMR